MAQGCPVLAYRFRIILGLGLKDLGSGVSVLGVQGLVGTPGGHHRLLQKGGGPRTSSTMSASYVLLRKQPSRLSPLVDSTSHPDEGPRSPNVVP